MTIALGIRTLNQLVIALDTRADEDTLRSVLEIARGFAWDGHLRLYDQPVSRWLAELADEQIRAAAPLPADTISAGGNGQYDPYYIAAVLLAAIAWLLTFAGPVMISKLPQADQSAMNDYYSGIPGLAIALTGYLITHRPKGK